MPRAKAEGTYIKETRMERKTHDQVNQQAGKQASKQTKEANLRRKKAETKSSKSTYRQIEHV